MIRNEETMEQRFARLQKIVDRSWVVAHNGQEPVTVKDGYRYQYMWNTFTKEHAYYCLDTDLFLSNEECRAIFG